MPEMTTYYEATAAPGLRRPPLSGSAEADTVIVGGGFAGLATALGLHERGVDGCMLLEARTIGYGASGRNGGFVSGGFSLDAARLHRRVGWDEARRLYQMTEAAVQCIRSRIERHSIDCDAVYGGITVASWFDEDHTLRDLQRLMREEFGLHWQWLSREALRERLHTQRYHAGLHETDAFHFNPLKYALGIARVLLAAGVRLHEMSHVRSIHRSGAHWEVDTGVAKVRCRRVVVCGGGYLDGFCRPLERSALPIATYVMVTEPLGARLADAMRTDAAVFDTRFAFDYYRPLPDTRLLWGGRMSIRQRSPADIERLLYRDMLRVYPQLEGTRITHAWSGLMSYSRHRMPQIGQLDEGLWYAYGFGGHGVAPTTMGGEVLARAITQEAAIPAALQAYGLEPVYGKAGLLAAQCIYWSLQARDALLDWWH